jgi:hypothetical protein
MKAETNLFDHCESLFEGRPICRDIFQPSLCLCSGRSCDWSLSLNEHVVSSDPGEQWARSPAALFHPQID